jgi:PKD repeat protein
MLATDQLSLNLTPPGWHASGSLRPHGWTPYHDAFPATPTFILGLGTYTMRSSRVFTLMTGVALIAACSGDDGNGPSNVKPTAAFTYECTNLVCVFTDQSSDEDGTIASRSWDFGDGSSGTGATANHTYTAAGDYDVTVEATDDGGLPDTSDPQTVTVTAGSATSSASFTATCTGLACVLDNTSTATGSVTTFEWTFGDGQTSTDEEPGSVVYTVTSPTTFTITLKVTSDGVLSQATKQVRVSPAATLTCNGVDCALVLDQAATVVVTLQTADCEAHGNTFVITAPAVDTLFTDGCFSPVSPAAGSSFTLNNGEAYEAGTELSAEVLTGLAGAENPQLRVTGTFETGWTLEFDDGFVGEGEPDFNDLVIKVVATPQ